LAIRYGKTSSSFSQKNNQEKVFKCRAKEGKAQEEHQGRTEKRVLKPLPEGNRTPGNI
jgi:hypothetical protein